MARRERLENVYSDHGLDVLVVCIWEEFFGEGPEAEASQTKFKLC